MSKKLAAKASLIQLPPLAAAAAAPAQPEAKPDGAAASGAEIPSIPHEPRVRTAPGSMAVFMASQSAAIQEAEALRLQLAAFEGAAPMRSIPAPRIRVSRWANRHADAFQDSAFAELKADIAVAGGNVQPVCVRALPPDGEGALYELVFGHRRHRACLDLELPVKAVVVELDDRALFEAMERENRSRKNLSAWEQGMMYRRALDGGLYPSQRKLADALNVDLALVSKSLALARLPEAVIGAFASPLDVQFRWAQPLGEALQRDPEGLVSRARALSAQRPALAARQVLERLLGAADKALNGSTLEPEARIGRPGQGAVLTHDKAGRATLAFDVGVLTATRRKALLDWLRDHLL